MYEPNANSCQIGCCSTGVPWDQIKRGSPTKVAARLAGARKAVGGPSPHREHLNLLSLDPFPILGAALPTEDRAPFERGGLRALIRDKAVERQAGLR